MPYSGIVIPHDFRSKPESAEFYMPKKKLEYTKMYEKYRACLYCERLCSNKIL